MANTEIVNLDGQKIGSLELQDAVFCAEMKQHLLWEVVKQQLASRRAGTHSTLRRSEVRGGGKKPYRQKGTGNARQGSSRAPNFVGGGKVFTPKPRDYSYTLPKKARKVALRSALSLRFGESKLVVVDSLELPEIKTKRMVRAFKALGLSSVLVLDVDKNENLAKSVRNLPSVTFREVAGLNVYDILRHEGVLLTPSTVRAIENKLAPEKAASSKVEASS